MWTGCNSLSRLSNKIGGGYSRFPARSVWGRCGLGFWPRKFLRIAAFGGVGLAGCQLVEPVGAVSGRVGQSTQFQWLSRCQVGGLCRGFSVALAGSFGKLRKNASCLLMAMLATVRGGSIDGPAGRGRCRSRTGGGLPPLPAANPHHGGRVRAIRDLGNLFPDRLWPLLADAKVRIWARPEFLGSKQGTGERETAQKRSKSAVLRGLRAKKYRGPGNSRGFPVLAVSNPLRLGRVAR